MVECTQCGNKLAGESSVASISGSISGDECTESYYFCAQCGLYTVVIFWDCFLGEETSSTRGPISKEEGLRKIELIRQCEESWNKKCRCKTHCEYFDNMLD
ncbi:MAG TPA: hypothetical protein PLI09_12270 [Candidatus Hydrogenedentes bacterium]|nr:hypothetical protein [Candidatus Hydrogenedentota bacterium]